MENRNGLLRQRSGVSRSLREGDFEEEDVWAVLKDHRTESISKLVCKIKEPSVVSSPKQNIPTAKRMIPRASNGGNCGSNSNFICEPKIVQQSAPINIPPDWSKIHNHKSKKAYQNQDNDDDDDDESNCFVNGGVDSDDEEDGDDVDGYDEKLPPHEFIARRLARSQISSFSVFEGVGRTLKGRDLSKVRNAVLIKTGFLESL